MYLKRKGEKESRNKILKIQGKKEKLLSQFKQELSGKFEELKMPNIVTKLFYEDTEKDTVDVENDDDFELYLNYSNGPPYHFHVEYDEVLGNYVIN